MTAPTAILRLYLRHILPFVETSSFQKCWYTNSTQKTSSSNDISDFQKTRSPRKHLGPLLERELGSTRNEIRDFFRIGGLTLDRKLFLDRLTFCRNMGLTDIEIKLNTSILLIPSELLLAQKDVLEECGTTRVTAQILTKYDRISRTRVALVKASGIIPQEVDVSKHVLSFARADVPPINYSTVTRKRSSSDIRGESWPLLDVHRFTILHYLMWFFKDEKIKVKTRTLKPLSFRRMLRVLEVLQSKINLDKKQLRQNLFLLHCDPEKLLYLLRTYPTIGGEDIKKLIASHPRLALSNVPDVQSVLQCVKEWGFDEKAAAFCPSILTLNAEELNERLSVLKQLPDVWALRHNRNVFRLLNERDLILKIRYIKSLPRRTIPTVPLLLRQDRGLIRALAQMKHIAPVRDFLTLLAAEFKTDTDTIKASISQHPLWRQGSSGSILETLSFLRSRGYSDKDILDNLPIVLYPRSFVETVLDNAVREACQSEESSQDLPKKIMELRFCLYYMEKEHGFSGYGIFEEVEESEKEKQPL